MLLTKVLAASVAACCLASAAVDSKWLEGLEWRAIGPAVMGGRIADLGGVPGDPARMWAAAGSGGLFATSDGGITWKPVFDRQSTISIGAIAVEPDNPNVIWVGTGESNVRNSVSFGDGVYKSADGGRTWTRTGLADTQTISRIAIDPRNPGTVWVAAVGHPFGPNAERGVFVTNDGGRTWRKSLFIDAEHGAADLEIDPHDPDTVYAAMWRFERKPWTYASGSEKGGVLRTTDGGRTWKKLGGGLPALAGRIGVKVAPSDPSIVYVIAESNGGTLFRSTDRGETFERLSSDRGLVGRGYYYADMRVAPDNANRIYVLSDALLESEDGGRSFRRLSPQVHGDVHALWIDPKDPRRIWQGHDGGLAVSYDRGAHWEQVNNIPLGQFYRVSADNRQPFYQVTGGTQDNGSWTGPARTREPGGIFNDDWRMVNGFNGFFSLADSGNPDILLTEQAGGVLLRTDLRTREQQLVSPWPRSNAGAPARESKYRFNWNAPLVLSPHGKSTLYLAGNVVFQSADLGRSWETISHDLTTADQSRLGNAGGPVWIDNSASEVYSTITAFAESPARRGVMWAGTDDGNLQVSLDGGGSWTNVAANLPGVPARSPFSHVEPSHTAEFTAYATLDRHMFDDFRPYIFRTTDGGQTWTSLAANLPPNAFVWVLREDPAQPRLLLAGTELGVYASFDAGASWMPLHLGNLPRSISVRDILIHPGDNDLIVATHGRSLWVLDDMTPLRQLAAGAGGSGPRLFPVRAALRHATRATRFGFGDKTFTGPNPAYGALITFFLPEPAAGAKVTILDAGGAAISEFAVPGGAGLHRVAWDLRYPPAVAGRAGGRGPQVLPGSYLARLAAGAKSFEQRFEVKLDPLLEVPAADLRQQFDTALEIRKMQRAAAAALERARAAGDDGRKLAARLSRPAAARGETGPKLMENLDALLAAVDGGNAAPTPAMLRYLGELRAEFEEITASGGQR